jgi:thioredoxin-dependent peroxiredoxin
MARLIKYLSIAGLVVLFGNKSHAQELKEGTKIPGFKLLNQEGKLFDIQQVLGKKNLVIYFYPKDETPGCTKEACYFRDQFEVFKDAGAEIIGISGQSVDSHKKFAENHQLPFILLSDTDNQVRKLFGVTSWPIPGRVTFVIDKSGIILYVFKSQMEATRHVDEAMRILKSLN